MTVFETVHKKLSKILSSDHMVGAGGFEPPKSKTTDLQSAPFGHSGTLPCIRIGAGGRTRTPDLLITNQLLYQLSYTSTSTVHRSDDFNTISHLSFLVKQFCIFFC